MFNLFKKSSVAASKSRDWGFVQTDIHSHILPGIDDGAQNIEDSLKLVESMYKHGYRKMVATPHSSEDIYPNDTATILARRDLLREAVLKEGIDMQIEAAAEYMIDERFVKMVESGEQMLTIHENRVLVEMSYLLESPYLHNGLFALQTHGYQPILAHPERYNFYHNSLEKYDELKEKGCLFQLNLIAFSGYYGKHVKKVASYLFEKGMYDYVGSDIHHIRHTNALHSVLQSKIMSELIEYPFINGNISL
ncbi:Tyrosine-protein phosphatase YwqE [Arachidicoccus rhizosphaerae]|uniref:protein-tyrosine-phosphatase n=1 Tax=Arachidicoccus rhizosphaerae TaxID=551991 RepID=A0A1H3WIQ0_9BACT|nr:CpsB/CapC family capsule biosynthesis tyrosine phosphatase [Arachidicoccus rhizosphaerae]SDZ86088.1 Tyrosine-protein phosphatase YwqE [Arachidicoccus rhizosphaerae]